MKLSDWKYTYKKNIIEIVPNFPIQIPDYFYKYYSITDYNIDAIINSKLYFSHPLVFNDLFDASIQMIDLNKISQQELVNLYDRYKEIVWVHEKKDYHSIKEFVHANLKYDKVDFLRTTLTFYWNVIFIKTGVLSLASIDNNILLWSYYTNHTGVAVEFQSLPIDNTEVFGPFPVNYSDKYETLNPKTAELDNEHLLYLTNVKSTDWRHENEWRLLLRRNNLSIPNYKSEKLIDENRLISYPKNIVNSIILGFKFFKGFIPYEVNKRTFKYTVGELDSKEYLDLKIKLLNYLVDNKIIIKQIQTNEDSTFCIEAANVKIEIIERDKIYVVTRSRENKRANLRLTNV